MNWFLMSRGPAGFGFLILWAATALGAPKPPLFPVQEGNYWILESSLGDQKIIRCEPGTNNLLQVTGLSERSVRFYGSARSTVLYRWDTTRRGRIRPILNLWPFKKKRHSKFSAGDHPCDQLWVELAPVAGSILARTGEYADCSVLSIDTVDSAIPGACNLLAERIYFAPGVGPVMMQGRLGRIYQLVEAQVGNDWISGP